MRISPAYLDYAVDLVWTRVAHHVGHATPARVASLCQEVIYNNAAAFSEITVGGVADAAAKKKQQQQQHATSLLPALSATAKTVLTTLDTYCRVNEAYDNGDIVAAVQEAIKLGDMELVVDLVRKSRVTTVTTQPTKHSAAPPFHSSYVIPPDLTTTSNQHPPSSPHVLPQSLNLAKTSSSVLSLPPIAAVFSDVAAEMASEEYIHKTSTRCPHCGMFVQHFRGHSCHHLTCGCCKRDFCYACGKPWDERHHIDMCDLYCGGDAELLMQSPFVEHNKQTIKTVAAAATTTTSTTNFDGENTAGKTRPTCRCVPCDSCQIGKPCESCNGNCPVCKGIVAQGNYNKIEV